jgi:hypothetical protein
VELNGLVVEPVELVGRWRVEGMGASFPQIHRRLGGVPTAFFEISLDERSGGWGVGDGLDEVVVVRF